MNKQPACSDFSLSTLSVLFVVSVMLENPHRENAIPCSLNLKKLAILWPSDKVIHIWLKRNRSYQQYLEMFSQD